MPQRRECAVHKAYKIGTPEAMRIPRNNCVTCWGIHFLQCQEVLFRFGYTLDYSLMPSNHNLAPESKMEVPNQDHQLDPGLGTTLVGSPDGEHFVEVPAQMTVETQNPPEIGSDEWLKEALGEGKTVS